MAGTAAVEAGGGGGRGGRRRRAKDEHPWHIRRVSTENGSTEISETGVLYQFCCHGVDWILKKSNDLPTSVCRWSGLNLKGSCYLLLASVLFVSSRQIANDPPN